MAGRAAMKKPGAAGRRVRRVGFKNYKELASRLAPFVTQKTVTTYTSSRDMKDLDKAKLKSRPSRFT